MLGGVSGVAELLAAQLLRDEVVGPVILGRGRRDVSGRIRLSVKLRRYLCGSMFTADMAIRNVIGDSFRGATWVSIHNGGGVGWGEVSQRRFWYATRR